MKTTTLLVIACGSVLAGCANQNPDYCQWYDKGREAYEREQYRFAISQLSRFIDQASPSQERKQALYTRGLAYALTGRRDLAYDDLLNAARPPASPETRWRAETTRATLLFEDQRWCDAAEAYGNAAAEMPAAPPLDEVLWKQGLALERCGLWEQALEAFGKLVATFENSRLRDPAERRLMLRPTHYAVQAGAFNVRENAENRKLALERRGFDAYIREEPRGGKNLYIVLVGHAEDYLRARALLAEVRTEVDDAVLWP